MTDTAPETFSAAATPESLARREHNLAVVYRFYDALASNDTSNVVPVATEDFVATVAEGMPNGLGGVYHGNVNAVSKIWGRIWETFYVHAEPAEFLPVDDDRVVVLGRYVGDNPLGGSTIDATFAHICTVRGDRLSALQQITDTAQWHHFWTR